MVLRIWKAEKHIKFNKHWRTAPEIYVGNKGSAYVSVDREMMSNVDDVNGSINFVI